VRCPPNCRPSCEARAPRSLDAAKATRAMRALPDPRALARQIRKPYVGPSRAVESIYLLRIVVAGSIPESRSSQGRIPRRYVTRGQLGTAPRPVRSTQMARIPTF
jgi:hypothetical protein